MKKSRRVSYDRFERYRARKPKFRIKPMRYKKPMWRTIHGKPVWWGIGGGYGVAIRKAGGLSGLLANGFSSKAYDGQHFAETLTFAVHRGVDLVDLSNPQEWR